MHVPDPPAETGNPTLKTFLDLLQEEAPAPGRLEPCLADLRTRDLVEVALQALKRVRPRSNSAKDPAWQGVRQELERLAEQARAQRARGWSHDPDRRTLRLALEIRTPACALNPSALTHALAEACLAAGLPVALGLEKKPRPRVCLGPPLPLGVEGLREWADLGLQEPLTRSLEAWRGTLNTHCPSGLRILSLDLVPNHGSPLMELAEKARWCWEVPADLRTLATERLAAFAAATTFEIEKTGKVEGAKALKRREVRGLVTAMEWQGEAFRFTTTLRPGEGLSPLKLLGGILQVEPARITDLTRLEVVLGRDDRQAQAYEPKLHNMYEDAVLLESSDTLRVVDDEDDDLLLGR